MRTLYLDTETYSDIDISAGAHRYAESPEACITLAMWALDDEPVKITEGPTTEGHDPALWKEFITLVRNPRVTKVAHNATFDRVQISAYTHGRATGEYLDPAEWIDTLHWAYLLGLPGSLKSLAKALRCEDKDSAGTLLINRFAKPQPATKAFRGGRRMPSDDPERWAEFRAYGTQDVEVLRQVHRALEREWEVIDLSPSALERAVELTAEKITDVGLPLDVEVLHALQRCEDDNVARQAAELKQITGLANPNSTVQLHTWFASKGLSLPDLRRGTVEPLAVDESLPAEVRRVAELRVASARVAGKKLAAAELRRGAGDRARGTLRYLGAHTGRWSGNGFQPQNLPREQLPKGETVDSVLDRSLLGEPVSPTEVAACVRSVVAGPLIVCDYTSIEAVVLAWLAGEQWVLDAYGAKRDLYVETASRMSSAVGHEMTRQEGKTALLGCGYGAGPNGLRAFAGDGPSDEALQAQVDAWRRANPRITALWDQLGREFRTGGERIVSGMDSFGRAYRRMLLPSGRTLIYRGIRATRDRWGRPSVAFWDTRRGIAVETFGGRLTENLVQAVARDCLASAMVRLDRAGFEIVAHVHDEVLIKGPSEWWDYGAGKPSAAGVASFRRVRDIMSADLPWAPGLHLRAAGGVVDRYRKLTSADEID
jgi:DNA polymerase